MKILKPRQNEIMALVVEGLDNKQIAYRMGIAHKTVKNQMSNIYAALGGVTRVTAAIMWLKDQENVSVQSENSLNI